MKKHYQIRLNVPSHAAGNHDKIWKIFEDGVEIASASKVICHTVSYTDLYMETIPDSRGRFERWNFACDGKAVWEGSILHIVEVDQ